MAEDPAREFRKSNVACRKDLMLAAGEEFENAVFAVDIPSNLAGLKDIGHLVDKSCCRFLSYGHGGRR